MPKQEENREAIKMKRARFFFLLFLAAVLASCGGGHPISDVFPLPDSLMTPVEENTPTPPGPLADPTIPPASPVLTPTFTIPPQATNTRHIFPTRTPVTIMPTATATILPLRTGGPYLAYLRSHPQNNEEQFEIILLDADGGGQRVIPFPPDANWQTKNFGLMNNISPDGKWMAYLSGSAGKCMGNGTENTNDLTLKLFNLGSGETRVVTKLTSANYPANFTEAARDLGDPNITAADLQNAFVCGLSMGSAWSPDGRQLAFAGQMAGVSSDLYVYDLGDGSIRQLSGGPQEIQSIRWSKDGQWISTTSAYVYGDGMQTSGFRTKADGSAVIQVMENTAPLPDSGLWLNDHQYYRSKSIMGMGAYGLMVVDLQAETTETVWPGYFSAPAFLPGKNWIAFYGTSISNRPEDDPPGFIPAIYLVNLATYQRRRIEMPAVPDVPIYSILAVPASQGEQFLLKASGADQEVFTLSTDGAVKTTGIRTADFLYQSPDKTMWLAIGKQIQVYSAENKLLYSADLPAQMRGGNIFFFVWRPDQTGLFFSYSPMVGESPSLSGIYAMDFPTGKVTKVDPSNVAAIYFNYSMWLEGPQ